MNIPEPCRAGRALKKGGTRCDAQRPLKPCFTNDRQIVGKAMEHLTQIAQCRESAV